ncbi:hypothetical protein HPP92_001249 [Vanilla planifolia]|uniref:B box-type domain-containing protein n=1 Tax=Vanilla planifolia TaxID=51239 RepID=A0A835RTM8_VANPL|nr:hypothetical protein HPP92_001249 [Vanilla planifolia]
MRIGCDVCGTAAAAVICCADEAALCSRCDEEVPLPTSSPESTADFHFSAMLQSSLDVIFVRALFCQDCDESIHIAGTLSAKHQRFLATGVRIGFNSDTGLDSEVHHPEPPNGNSMVQSPKIASKVQATLASTPTLWAIDDIFQLPEYEATNKRSPAGFAELSWFSGIGLSPESERSLAAAAEVPQILFSQPGSESLYRAHKTSMPFKKPRMEMLQNEDFFTVPDLG